MNKTCKKCNAEKNVEADFHADKRNRDGRDGVCKECKRAVTRAWNANNKERHCLSSRRDYDKNRAKRIAAAVEWNRANPERRKELVADWSRRHPERVRQGVQRRRARKLGCASHFTVEDVATLAIRQAGLCAYCDVGLVQYHVDHIVPLSRGGGDGADNICLACPPCNMSKGSRLLIAEWWPPKIPLAFQWQVG